MRLCVCPKMTFFMNVDFLIYHLITMGKKQRNEAGNGDGNGNTGPSLSHSSHAKLSTDPLYVLCVVNISSTIGHIWYRHI